MAMADDTPGCSQGFPLRRWEHSLSEAHGVRSAPPVEALHDAEGRGGDGVWCQVTAATWVLVYAAAVSTGRGE